MDLVFKQKAGRLFSDNETSLLFKFLITYPQYIELTFSILWRRYVPVKNIRERIEVSPEIDTVEGDKKLNTYYEIMNLFYDTTKEVLEKRRGKLLELLVSNIKPINPQCEYEIILECLVEYKGVKVSEKDIDVVFQYDEIELIECKARLSAYLYPPNGIYRKKKEKLDFMEKVKRLAIQSSVNCHLFFATYGQDKEYCKDILARNGYTCFGVINRERIIESLNKELVL